MLRNVEPGEDLDEPFFRFEGNEHIHPFVNHSVNLLVETGVSLAQMEFLFERSPHVLMQMIRHPLWFDNFSNRFEQPLSSFFELSSEQQMDFFFYYDKIFSLQQNNVCYWEDIFGIHVGRAERIELIENSLEWITLYNYSKWYLEDLRALPSEQKKDLLTHCDAVVLLIKQARISFDKLLDLEPCVRQQLLVHANNVIEVIKTFKLPYAELIAMSHSKRGVLLQFTRDLQSLLHEHPPVILKDLIPRETGDWYELVLDPTSEKTKHIMSTLQEEHAHEPDRLSQRRRKRRRN